MRLLLSLALLCVISCGVRPSCVLLDVSGNMTMASNKGQQCFLRGDKDVRQCCHLQGLENATSAESRWLQGCQVKKAFGGKGEVLSGEAVVLDGREELLLCFNTQHTEMQVWLSCRHGNELVCVALKFPSDGAASKEKQLSKRSSGAVYAVRDNTQDRDKSDHFQLNSSGHVTLVVSVASLGLLALLVMLCAGGSSRKHTFQSNNDVESGTTPEHKQDNNAPVQPQDGVQVAREGDEEVQELHLQLPENPGEVPPVEARGNSPPEEGQGQIEPQGGVGAGDGGPEGQGREPDALMENGGRDQEDEDDPRYDEVRHPQQQVQLPAAPMQEADQPASPGGESREGVSQRNGVKISYAVVSRHPGQPPYASVSEVLPAAEAAPVDEGPPRDEEGYDQVIREKGAQKNGYAEVRIGNLTDEPTVYGDADEPSQHDGMYDTVGYDSVNHPAPASASQDSAKDDMYEVVPDSVRQLSPTHVKDVAPELPPMRVRGISASEDDSRVQSLEGSGKESKKEGRGSKENKPAKEKGGGKRGIFRHRSSTVTPTSKSKEPPKGKDVLKENEVFEGPPLPPNHPPAGFPRTSTSGTASLPRTSSSSVPPNVPPPPPPEDDDCYSEPFDRGPATGPPRKMTNSARPFSNEHHALSKSARGQSLPALSPRGGAPSFPLPDIPPLSETDPEYESVDPETQRAALARASLAAGGEGEGEELPYDTVGGASTSTGTGAMGVVVARQQMATEEEEEEESPYDVVARVPGTSVAVSVGATTQAMAAGGGEGEGEEEEEETPYDTVAKVPGTSVAVSLGALGRAVGEKARDDGAKEPVEHPYSKINKSRAHAYATVDKSKTSEEEDPPPCPMTPPTTSTLEHDDMGYAVVSEEYKRARTMSRDAQAMVALVKKKAPAAESSDYSVVADDLRKKVLTGAVDGGEGVMKSPDLLSTPSPPPPISPIKDRDIVLEFCAPETPPHPILDAEEGSESSKPSSRQLMLSAGDASSPEVEQRGLLTESENPYDVVDDDLKGGYRESPQL